jgi:hypothetical protein
MRLWGKKVWVHAMIKNEDLDKLPQEVIDAIKETP